MAKNQTVKERLISYLSYLGVGQTRFEKDCGLANGYINNIRRSITPKKLQIIARYCPDLNTGWLMTGEGEMLKNSQHLTINNKEIHDNGTVIEGGNAANSPISVSSGNCAQQIAALQQRIADKDALIASLQKQVSNLEELIAMLRK